MMSFATATGTEIDRSRAFVGIDFLGFTVFMRAMQRRAATSATRRAARIARQQVAAELAMFTDLQLSELGFSRADLGSIEGGFYSR